MMKLVLLLFILLPVSAISQEYEEDFDFFLVKFDQNPSFQFSRLQDTITVAYSSDIIIDEEGNGTTDENEFRISRNDWSYKQLDNKQHHDWEIKQPSKKSRQLIIVGKQSGVYVVIDFILINGLWFLKKYADYTV